MKHPSETTQHLGNREKFFIENGKKIGRAFRVIQDNVQRKGMEKAGFLDIQEFNYKVNSQHPPEVTYQLPSPLDALGRLGQGPSYEATRRDWASSP